MPANIEFTIVPGDIRTFEADVVALKHAQTFLGADKAVADALGKVGVDKKSLQAGPNEYRLVNTRGGVRAGQALFIGMPTLAQIDYHHIKEFAARSLLALHSEAPNTRHLALTIHGPGFWLDEVESFLAEFTGCLEAIQAGAIPDSLERISIVERNDSRVQRLRQALEEHLNAAAYATRAVSHWAYFLSTGRTARTGHAPPPTRGVPAPAPAPAPAAPYRAKPHAFVAMPFKKEMDDIFYYGIQGPVRSAGFLCERVDQEAFVGDIMDRVRQKIETASVVIADLTGANPNVYLEVGYAWGVGRPTILVVANETQLQFDVRGQRCLTYARIKDLEEALTKELNALKSQGLI